MLIFIVIIFMCCWGPRLIMNVIIKLGLRSYNNFTYTARICCYLLSFIHSSLNPFVYGFMSSNFRKMMCKGCSSSTRTLSSNHPDSMPTNLQDPSDYHPESRNDRKNGRMSYQRQKSLIEKSMAAVTVTITRDCGDDQSDMDPFACVKGTLAPANYLKRYSDVSVESIPLSVFNHQLD